LQPQDWSGILRTQGIHPEGMVTVESTEKEARKALVRLRRAVEKSQRELDSLMGAIRHAEGDDFPQEEYEGVQARMDEILEFLEEEGRRLEEKILQTGGLEPGRIRRGS
jgi:hypothetical protein